jgi:hypothetical protein
MDAQATGEPSNLKREHEIFFFFLFLWVIFSLPDPDPQPCLQHVPALENLLAEETDEGLQALLQQVQEAFHKDQVIRLAHAEVVVEGHVVEEGGVLREVLATEEAAAAEGQAFPLRFLHQQHLQRQLNY